MSQTGLVRQVDSQSPQVLPLPTKDSEPADGEDQQHDEDQPLAYEWDDGDPAAKNFKGLGALLCRCGHIFRRPGYANGLLLVLPGGQQVTIKCAADLAPLIVDRVALTVFLDGKPKGSKLPAAQLNAMLRSESFLGQFPPVDHITTVPVYQPDFSLTEPDFNDGGPGHRVLYLGPPPLIYDSLDRVNAFLDVMDF
jgi:hypothetical protein